MTDQAPPTSTRPSLWDRLCRFNLTRSRRTRQRLAEFCFRYASGERTLVVHCPDVDYRRFFPDCFVVSSKRKLPADQYTDRYYEGLAEIGDASFGQILCTGLLEHVPDPQRVIDQFHRILRPGGRLILSASAVFAFHGAPDNFFHFTSGGFGHLCRNWSKVEVIRGSTQPFETVAVLLQRINMQCDIFPPARLLVEVMFHLMPLLDVFVLRQYPNHHQRQRSATGEFMPATLQAVVIK